jgi:hypothetical protein
MGLLPSNLRLLIQLHKRVGLEGPVLTLGNQDIFATYEDLKGFFRELDCPFKEPAVITPHTSPGLEQFSPGTPFVHARTFFEMLGIGDYSDIDKFEEDKPLILHDMNEPLPDELRERYSLVVDSGTIEHIFDIKQVMDNIVAATKVGGRVFHLTPSSNYIDHGLYLFSPCFFFDFYELNGFDDLSCHILQVDEHKILERCAYFEYSYGMPLADLIDPTKVIVICFSARKTEAVPELRVPTQGVYNNKRVGLTASVEAQARELSIYESRIPAPLRPLLKPVRSSAGHLWRRLVPRYKQLKRI